MVLVHQPRLSPCVRRRVIRFLLAWTLTSIPLAPSGQALVAPVAASDAATNPRPAAAPPDVLPPSASGHHGPPAGDLAVPRDARANPQQVCRQSTPTSVGLRPAHRNSCAASGHPRLPQADNAFRQHAPGDTTSDIDVQGAVPAQLAGGPPPSFASPDWLQVQPAASPAGRYGNAVAYDEAHHQVVVFGGTDGTTFFNDTWVWDGSTWTQKNVSPAPAARIDAQMAYDEATGTVILFGGYATATPNLNDTWSWNGTAWTLLSPTASPPGRSEGAIAYDVQISRLVLFGGVTAPPSGGTTALADTWTFNGTTWTQLQPATAPTAREAMGAAYDSADGTVVIFGGAGQNGGALGDTWTFNGTTWAQANPAASPPARQEYYLAYDAGLGGVVLFGGYNGSTGDLNDTWLWKGGTWYVAQGIASPSGRDSGGMAFDQLTGQVVQFGGFDGFHKFNETWVYNAGAATIADSVSAPTGYRGSLLTYTVSLGNASPSSGLTGVGMTEIFPTGLTPAGEVPPMTLTDSATGSPVTCPSCTVSGQTVTVSGLSIAAQDRILISFDVVAVGVERFCSLFTDNAAVTGIGQSATAQVQVAVCDTGLGTQPWWTYTTQGAVGPQSSFGVNVADGNLVLSQEDATVVPDRGLIRFGLTRTYNSQDDGQQPLPATMGSGWVVTEGQEGIASGGVTASGFIVPGKESYAGALPVTLVDGSGTRHLFTPRALGQVVDVTEIVQASAPTSPLGVLKPHQLATDLVHYDHVCVDKVYAAPTGIHLSVWRYVELVAAGSATPCAPASGTTPVVLGYGAERPDRVRFEFAWDGHLVDLMDGNGNELRYLYDALPSAGATLGHLNTVTNAAGTRSMSFSYVSAEADMRDAAGRTTRYLFDTATPPHLVSIVNPDGGVVNADGTVNNPSGTRLTYTYGGCSNAAPYELCATTDPRGASTGWTYGAPIVANTPPRATRITDRGGTSTSLTYSSSPDYVIADTATERSQYLSIDSTGRVGEVDSGAMTNTWYHEHVFTWDAPGATCRQPDAMVDNNLCTVVTRSLGGTPDSTVRLVYNAEGYMLDQHESVTSSVSRDRSAGYSNSYLEAAGNFNAFADGPQGSGRVVSSSLPSGARSDSNTILYLSDLVSTLPPRGNAAGSGYAAYETNYSVDNNPGVNPSLVNAGGTCTSPSGTRANTGNVCYIDAPSFDGVYDTITRYSYTPSGDIATVETPKAVAETPSGPVPAYTMTYYGASDHDLSGSVSADGWLKAVTDPAGNFVALAYDAAGNRTRVWDRDATQGHAVTDFPGTIAAPTTGGFTETLHNTGGNAYSLPWRSVLSQRDQLGDTTGFDVDANGNQTRIRSPRGSQAGNTSFDTVQTFDARDELLTKLTPAEASANTPWQYAYDVFGNRTSTTDPNGHVTVTVYDTVNRPVGTKWSRGSVSGELYTPASCTTSTVQDAPLPAGVLMCSTGQSYDGENNVTAATDGNGHATAMTYDALHEVLTKQVPRDPSTELTTQYLYDLNGNVTDVCSPREFTEGAKTCTVSGLYSAHMTYDRLDRKSSVTTYGAAGAETTNDVYDADGNVVSETNPNRHTTTAQFNLLDQRVGQTVPRDAGTTETTTWTYDPSGSVTSATQPGSLITAYSYDAAHRRIDTVQGASSVVAGSDGPADASGGSNVRTRSLYDADGNVVATFDPRAFTSPSDLPSNPDTRFMVRTDYDADGRAVQSYVPRFDNNGAGYSDEDYGSGQDWQAAQCTPTPSPLPHSVPGVPAYTSGVALCVTRATYDGAGNLVSEYLPTSNGSDNRYVTFGYTDDNLLLSVNAPDPSVPSGGRIPQTTYGYDADGKQVIAQDPKGRQTVTSLTEDELPTSVVAPTNTVTGVNHITDYAYDANGNTTTEVDAATSVAQSETVSTYFSDNRLHAVTRGYGAKDPTTNQPLDATTSYTYDANGNTSSVTSPSANAVPRDAANTSGVSTAMAYTQDNLLSTMTVPFSPDGSQQRRTAYSYDGAGRKLSQHVYLVDSNGNAVSGQDGRQQAFAYFNDGRMSSQTGRDGTAIQYGYDAAGHTTSVQYSTGGPSLTATYYLDGLLRSVFDGTQSWDAAYDGSGALISRGEGYTNLVNDPYVQITNNDAGLPITETSSGPGVSWSYDIFGRRTNETDPNGVQITDQYADDGTLTSRSVSSGSATVAQWQYTYDSEYRQTAANFTGQSAVAGQGTLTASFSYQYDALGRVTNYTTWTGNQNVSQPVSWDHNGDRLSIGTPHGLVNWTYNADGSIASLQLQSTPVQTYRYAATGDMISDGCTSYAYDGFDRLSTATPGSGAGCPAPGPAVSYTYDGLDREVSRADSTGTTQLSYDGLSATTSAEQSPPPTGTNGGTQVVLYTLDPAGQRQSLLEFLRPSVNAVPSSTTAQYLATDGSGNITTVTNSDGSLACTALFDAFGNAQGAASPKNPCSSGSTFDTYFYRGGRVDGTTGDYQFGSRVYDPTKGVFTTPDSYRTGGPDANVGLAVDPLTANGFAYAAGDPVNFWDPSGHDVCRENPQDCDTGNPVVDQGLRGTQAAGSRAGVGAPGSSSVPWSSSNHRPAPMPPLPARTNRLVSQNDDPGPARSAAEASAAPDLAANLLSTQAMYTTQYQCIYRSLAYWVAGRHDYAQDCGGLGHARLDGSGLAWTASNTGVSTTSLYCDVYGVCNITGGVVATTLGIVVSFSTRAVEVDPNEPVAPERDAGGAAVQAGTRVYRVWGKDPTDPDVAEQQSGPWGSSWTRVDPRTVANYRNAAGLPDELNLGRFLSIARLSDVSGVTVRAALPMDGNEGGLDEVLIPDPAEQVKMEEVMGVSPEY